MRKVFLLLLLATWQIVFSQDKLIVTTFNIWDPGDKEYWDERGGYPVDRVVEYITEDSADIILLQEVTLEKDVNQSYLGIKRQVEKLGYIYSAFYRPNWSTGIGVVGYVRGMDSSGYPLAIFSKYPIMETMARQTLNGMKMAKGVLSIRIDLDGSDFFIFNTHFTIGYPDSFNEMKKVVLPFVNSVAGGSPTLIGGDWNCPSAIDFPDKKMNVGKYTYSTKTDKLLLDAGFTDAYRSVHPENNFPDDATYPGEKEEFLKRIDRIYLRNTNIKPVKVFIKENIWEPYGLSDHRAVVFVFDGIEKK